MAVTLLPPAPDPNNPATFSARAQAFVAALNNFVAEVNALSAFGSFPDGTPAAPSMAYAGDLDTGFFRRGANQIGVSTGGVERIAIGPSNLNVDLTVTGSGVQSNSHDAAVGANGKLAKVAYNGGLFGLGNELGRLLPAVTDCDTVTASGYYRITNLSINTPMSGSEYGLLRVYTGAGTAVATQKATLNWAYGGTRTFERRCVATGVWEPWSLVYNQSNILGAVSYAAGAPTGALIETGSNANGRYQRFANGLQICTRADISIPSMNTVNGSLWRSGDIVWTFPAAFISAADVVVSGSSDYLHAFLNTNTVSSTNCRIRANSTNSVSTAYNARVQAIGRWF